MLYNICYNMTPHMLYNIGLFQKKIHTPTMEGMLENLTGGGVNGSGKPDGRGALNPKMHPRG